MPFKIYETSISSKFPAQSMVVVLRLYYLSLLVLGGLKGLVHDHFSLKRSKHVQIIYLEPEYDHHILPIKRTVRIEVGKFFFSFSAHLNDWVLAVIAPLRSRCSVSLDVCSYNRACETVNWSIVQSCGEYEQWECEGTAEIAEFSAGLQTRQEERYVILLFLLLLRRSFTSFSWHLRWSFTT